MKKKLKLAGNILTIGAVILIVRKILGMDIDFSQLGSAPVLSALCVSTVVQSAIITFGCVPWLIFIQSLSGRKIPFSKAMPVYTNSNIYKYIPGNVFQYIGRNQLAADMEISHVDVACATILDIFFSVLSTGVISVILLGGKVAELLGKYGRNMALIGCAGVAVLAAAAVVAKWKFSDKIKAYLSRYSKAFLPENRGTLLLGVGYYFGQNLISATSYFICMRQGAFRAADSYGSVHVRVDNRLCDSRRSRRNRHTRGRYDIRERRQLCRQGHILRACNAHSIDCRRRYSIPDRQDIPCAQLKK